MCALHCAQLLHTVLHRTDLIIFPLTLHTVIIFFDDVYLREEYEEYEGLNNVSQLLSVLFGNKKEADARDCTPELNFHKICLGMK